MSQGKKKGLSTKKFDRCVIKVKRKGGGKNHMQYAMPVSAVNQNQAAKVRVARN